MANIYEQASKEAYAHPSSKKSAYDWKSPVSLVVRSESAPYPIDVLPDTLREAVLEVEDFTQAPLAMIATTAITTMSAITQSHYDVERAPSLHGPTSLYGLILAESGERKTSVEEYFLRPIIDHDKHHRINGEKDRELFTEISAAWESEKNNRSKALANAKKPQEKADALDLLKDHIETKLRPPRTAKILATDITPEQLSYSLSNLWPSKYLATSEGGLVFGGHGMKSDNILKNLAVLNTGWGGKVEGVDRRTTESYPASDGVRLSASIMVQPQLVKSFFEKSGNVVRGSGFLARFLVCWPESKQGYRQFKLAPDSWPHLTRLQSVMTALLVREPLMDEEGHLTPEKLQFSEEGLKRWIAVYNSIEIELRKGGELFDLKDSASKAADNVARLAAVFHSAEVRSGPIEADLIEAAAIIVAWHLDEAKRLFNELDVPDSVLRAIKLSEWLVNEAKKTGKTHITMRRISQYAPNAIRAKPIRDAAIDLLSEASHLRIDDEGETTVVELNPALLK